MLSWFSTQKNHEMLSILKTPFLLAFICTAPDNISPKIVSYSDGCDCELSRIGTNGWKLRVVINPRRIIESELQSVDVTIETNDQTFDKSTNQVCRIYFTRPSEADD